MATPTPILVPILTEVVRPRRPRGVVLMLHGGAERDTTPLTGRSLSWHRGRRLLRDVGGRLERAGLAGVLLRYRVRGWNARPGATPDPVSDARWALETLRVRVDLPVVLLGHSMGARTAVAVADDRSVRGVVALAPWLPAGDSVDPLHGRVLLAAHGRLDPITSWDATRAFVERAQAVSDARFVDMGRAGHYLLRRVRAWNEVAAAGCLEIMA